VKDFGRVPWPKVYEYLLQVESSRTPGENLDRILHGRGDSPYPNLTVQVVSERFRSLSRREAELCCHTSENCIAFLYRTVERHVENIFAKLNVRSRGQLRTTLGAV
jgi:hypothetical protein